MSDRIGGGIHARQMRQIMDYEEEKGVEDVEVHIWTDQTRYDHPSVVIPNLLEIRNLRDYLDRIVKAHPKYYKRL